MNQWHKSSSLAQATRFALRGIVVAGRREQNVRIHFLIGTLAVCALLILRAPVRDVALVLFTIAFVIGLEFMNTSIEILADTVHPEYNGAIRDVKDIAAGAVLLASITAGVVGLLVFSSTIEAYIL